MVSDEEKRYTMEMEVIKCENYDYLQYAITDHVTNNRVGNFFTLSEAHFVCYSLNYDENLYLKLISDYIEDDENIVFSTHFNMVVIEFKTFK